MRTRTSVFLGSALLACLLGSAEGARRSRVDVAPAFDSRFSVARAAGPGESLRAPSAAQGAAADALRRRSPGLVITWRGLHGGPSLVAAARGARLAAPDPRGPEHGARAFLERHAALFGFGGADLELAVTQSLVRPGQSSHVRFVQQVDGVDVFDSHLLASFDREGGLVSVAGALFPGLRRPGRPSLDAVSAVRLVASELYPETPFDERVVAEPNAAGTVRFARGAFGMRPEARLVLFPDRRDGRLAWQVRVTAPDRSTSYLVVVDAHDGSVLWRRNLTLRAEARFLDAPFPDPQTEEYAPSRHVLQPIPASTPESPVGWIAAPGDLLSGNNAAAHLVDDLEPVLAGLGDVYDFRYNTLEAAAVNAWWWSNDAHDRLYRLGFNEAAGNFQQDNLGNGGAGGDPVQVVVHAWGGRDNAYFNPTPDGQPPVMDFLWVGCSFCDDHDGYPENEGERNSAFPRDVVWHEYVHGLTTRRIGWSCLSGIQSGAMGEGWSDALSASFGADPRFDEHLWYGLGWERDLRQDLVYEDLCRVADGECEIHADGLIWAGALWDLRESMIALDPVSGAETFERLVYEGLNWTPCTPTMLDGRTALLQADSISFGGAWEQVIWNVFAARRMGQGASSTWDGDTNPVGSASVPAGLECTPPAAPSGLTATPDSDNAIRLDYSAPGASSIEIWREDLDNPIDRPVLIGRTTDTASWTDANVQGGRSYRYHLVALGSAGITCRSAESAPADALAAGACDGFPVFDSRLRASPGAGCTVEIAWDPAAPACPGATDPVVYSVFRGPAPGFEPSRIFLVGRTNGTTFVDTPPEGVDSWYYTVLAEHGRPEDPPDLRDRGDRQPLRWVTAVPSGTRTTIASWDFESGPDGWTVDNSADPSGGWVLVEPHGARYGGAPFAPDAASSGSFAWVTGDAAQPRSIADTDCDGSAMLISPVWDGTGGATILSFDWWNRSRGDYESGIYLIVDTGAETAQVFVDPFPGVPVRDAVTRTGWQRAEIDLAAHVTPTATMQVTFVAIPDGLLAEYGIDDVRVESASSCARSALVLDDVLVDDTAFAGGNGNGLLEPGETARLVLDVRNAGSATASAPIGRVRLASPQLLVHEDAIAYPDIDPGQVAGSTGDGVTVTLAPDVSCGDTILLVVEVTDAAGTRSDLYWYPENGGTGSATVFSDDFETDKGWVGDGVPGAGLWERGDPVGTFDGGSPANPEDDSPTDAGTRCYVTENGSPGGDVNATDVDGGPHRLYSPAFDLHGYKRATLEYALWLYDASDASDPLEDYATVRAYTDADGPDFVPDAAFEPLGTNGWEQRTVDLTPYVPMIGSVHVWFSVGDRDSDNVLEMGVDDVRVTGTWPDCLAPPSTDPPAGIGDTLRVSRSADVELSWQASPTGPGQGPADYYEVHVSVRPDSGFAVEDTATVLRSSRTAAGGSEFYRIVAVNAAGSSGDEPSP
ncbi:MAG: hypothetical protein D6738_01825 [Acidobacteria bacterium]|nr:MAG: hypothetical protein D6738_01825 [Acidobacteriota bacterium]